MTFETKSVIPAVFYRKLKVEGVEIFYREAGPRDAPTVLLLHGFPSLNPNWTPTRRSKPLKSGSRRHLMRPIFP